tara:strand:+ start:1048 stop:1233 length:186 start_codon:yes stop_codon:yes gene_type:complete
MSEITVGRIKNISINEDTGELNVLIVVTDSKFKKKLLRDLSLSGNIKFENDKIVFTGNKIE